MATLKVDIRVGESLRIAGSGSATLTLLAKSGQRARFEVVRDESMRVDLPKAPSNADVVKGGLSR